MKSRRAPSALPAWMLLLSVGLCCSTWGATLRACPTEDPYEDRDPHARDPDELFREGRRLLLQNRYAEACPKFAESYSIERSGGTILHLAICHQHEGKPTLAWLEFLETIELARCDKREDRETYAQKALLTIEAELPRLIVDLSPETARRQGLEVKLDGTVIPAMNLSQGIPAPHGEHTVTASAPGHVSTSTAVTIPQDAVFVTVNIAPLEALPDGAASVSAPAVEGVTRTESEAPKRSEPARKVVAIAESGGPKRIELPPPSRPTYWTPQRTTSVGMGIGGLIGLGIGVILSSSVMKSYDSSAANLTLLISGAVTLSGLHLFVLHPTPARTGRLAPGSHGASLNISPSGLRLSADF